LKNPGGKLEGVRHKEPLLEEWLKKARLQGGGKQRGGTREKRGATVEGSEIIPPRVKGAGGREKGEWGRQGRGKAKSFRSQ